MKLRRGAAAREGLLIEARGVRAGLLCLVVLLLEACSEGGGGLREVGEEGGGGVATPEALVGWERLRAAGEVVTSVFGVEAELIAFRHRGGLCVDCAQWCVGVLQGCGLCCLLCQALFHGGGFVLARPRVDVGVFACSTSRAVAVFRVEVWAFGKVLEDGLPADVASKAFQGNKVVASVAAHPFVVRARWCLRDVRRKRRLGPPPAPAAALPAAPFAPLAAFASFAGLAVSAFMRGSGVHRVSPVSATTTFVLLILLYVLCGQGEPSFASTLAELTLLAVVEDVGLGSVGIHHGGGLCEGAEGTLGHGEGLALLLLLLGYTLVAAEGLLLLLLLLLWHSHAHGLLHGHLLLLLRQHLSHPKLLHLLCIVHSIRNELVLLRLLHLWCHLLLLVRLLGLLWLLGLLSLLLLLLLLLSLLTHPEVTTHSGKHGSLTKGEKYKIRC